MTLEWPSPTGSASIGPLAEAVLVEVGLERPPDEQRRAVERVRLLRGCRRSRSRGRRVCRRRNLGGGSRVSGTSAPPMRRTPRHSSLLLCCSPPSPRRRRRRARSAMTFEAPRELLDSGHARPHAAGDPGLRRRPRARARLLAGLRAGRDRQAAPGLRRRRTRTPIPPAPGTAWTACSRRRRRAASAVQLTLTGPVPRWATSDEARPRDAPEPEGVPGLRHRRRPALRRPRQRVVDLERAQPPAVPAPAVRAEAGEVPAHLPQPLPGGPARAGALRATAATSCCSARPRRAAPRAWSPRWPSCAARCASTAATTARAAASALEAGGYAHHAYTTRVGPRFRPPDRDDVTIGVLSRLTKRARPRGARGRDPARPRRLSDRVRDPEHPRPVRRRDAGAPGRVPRDRRAHGLRQPARALVLAVPAQ